MSIRTRRNSKRLLAGVLAGAFALSGVAVSSSVAADDVAANDGTIFNTQIQRVAGADRYETAVAAALEVAEGYGTAGVGVVILAAGDNFPDGLAAAGLQGGLAGLNPVTLLTRGDALPQITAEAIEAFEPGIVIIVGGTAAISQAVEDQVGTILADVEPTLDTLVLRISGANRYETAAAITEVWVELSSLPPVRAINNCAVLATGENFPDALAAGAIAVNGIDGAVGPCTVLLNQGAALLPSTADALASIGTSTVYVVGGTAAIPASVATQLTALGHTVVRYSGLTRYDTAARIASAVAGNSGTPSEAILANGQNFADALSASQLTAGGVPILLTQTATPLPDAVSVWLSSYSGSLADLTVIGGTAAVSQGAAGAAGTAANAKVPGFVGPAAVLTYDSLGFGTGRIAVPVLEAGSPVPGVTLSAVPGSLADSVLANAWTVNLVSGSAATSNITVNNGLRSITITTAVTGMTVQALLQAWGASPASNVFNIDTGNFPSAGDRGAATLSATGTSVALNTFSTNSTPVTLSALVGIDLNTQLAAGTATVDVEFPNPPVIGIVGTTVSATLAYVNNTNGNGAENLPTAISTQFARLLFATLNPSTAQINAAAAQLGALLDPTPQLIGFVGPNLQGDGFNAVAPYQVATAGTSLAAAGSGLASTAVSGTTPTFFVPLAALL